MTIEDDAPFAEWDQAAAELISTIGKLKTAREGGNPASIARAWSTSRATESRFNAVGNKIEPQVENWLSQK